MVNVKGSVTRARRAEPNFLLVSCEELDNGVIFFGKQKGTDEVPVGAVGLFVSGTTPTVSFVSMGFYAEHDVYDGREVDISRFQTPEERREAEANR